MFFETFSSVYAWGMDFIHLLQSIATPALTAIIKGITFLGNPEICIMIILLLSWCIDEKRGFRLSLLMGLSTGLNYVIKNSLKVPRPYKLDPSVMLLQENDFSTPSGHSQNSAVLWPFLAKNIESLQKKKYNLVKLTIAFLFPLLIGFSRVYLGVHYPSDVLMGWSIGFLFVLCEFVFGERIAESLKKVRRSIKILAGFLPCFLLLCIDNTHVKMPAFVFGLIAGKIYMDENGGFSAKEGKLYQKIIRFCVGLLLAGAVYYLLEFAKDFEKISRYVLFLQYCFLGWWITFGAPQVFEFLHLTGIKAEKMQDEEKEVSDD